MRKNRTLLISTLLTAAIIVALSLWCGSLFSNGADRVLFVLPKSTSDSFGQPGAATGGISIERIKNLTDEGAVLSYANATAQSAKSVQSTYAVTVIGTNQYYPIIRSYQMVNGSFFTAEQHDYKNRVAVLNTKAAFDLFGSEGTTGRSLVLNGQPYLVLGVIRDGDEENRNIFVPGPCFTESAGTVLAKADNPAAMLEIRAQLNRIGINDIQYDFAYLGDFSAILHGNLTAVPLILIVCVLLIIAWKLGLSLRREWAALRQKMRQRYLAELLRNRDRSVLLTAALPFAIAAVLTTCLLLSQTLLVQALSLYDAMPAALSMLRSSPPPDIYTTSGFLFLSGLLLPLLSIEVAALTVNLCRKSTL